MKTFRNLWVGCLGLISVSICSCACGHRTVNCSGLGDLNSADAALTELRLLEKRRTTLAKDSRLSDKERKQGRNIAEAIYSDRDFFSDLAEHNAAVKRRIEALRSENRFYEKILFMDGSDLLKSK